MYLNRCGEADGLACQPLDPRASPQVLARNLRRVSLARLRVIRVDMAGVCTPIGCIITCDAEGLQQRLELQEEG